MKPLNLREFGESLRASGNEWGDQIIEASDAPDALAFNEDVLDKLFEYGFETNADHDDPASAVALVGKVAKELNDIHSALERIGILDGSPDPDIPAILAMLLGG